MVSCGSATVPTAEVQKASLVVPHNSQTELTMQSDFSLPEEEFTLHMLTPEMLHHELATGELGIEEFYVWGLFEGEGEPNLDVMPAPGPGDYEIMWVPQVAGAVVGAASNAMGNIAGQTMANPGQPVHWRSVAWAAGTGAVLGAISPYTAVAASNTMKASIIIGIAQGADTRRQRNRW